MGIKRERYEEAYSRIDSSIESGHFFEAITIEESILSDRIASFLEATDTLASSTIHRQGFAALISLWKVATSTPGAIWEACDDLIDEVDKWRQKRNQYVHGLVKFPNQKANIPTTVEFISGAQQTAVKGKELANLVSEWRRRQGYVKGSYTKKKKARTQIGDSAE